MATIINFILNVITPLRIVHTYSRWMKGRDIHKIGHTHVYIFFIRIVKWQRIYPWPE